MMNQPRGIEGPHSKPPVSASPEDVSGGNVQAAMHTPIRTLDDLKNVLISNFGEKEGKKAYDSFMMSCAMLMLSQMQHAMAQDKKAAQRMRTDVS